MSIKRVTPEDRTAREHFAWAYAVMAIYNTLLQAKFREFLEPSEQHLDSQIDE